MFKIFKCGGEENFIFLESGAIIMQFTGKTQETTFPLPRIFLPDFIYREAADPITSSSVVKSMRGRRIRVLILYSKKVTKNFGSLSAKIRPKEYFSSNFKCFQASNRSRSIRYQDM